MRARVKPPGAEEWQEVPAEYVKVLQGPIQVIALDAGYMADKKGWKVQTLKGWGIMLPIANPFAPRPENSY